MRRSSPNFYSPYFHCFFNNGFVTFPEPPAPAELLDYNSKNWGGANLNVLIFTHKEFVMPDISGTGFLIPALRIDTLVPAKFPIVTGSLLITI